VTKERLRDKIGFIVKSLWTKGLGKPGRGQGTPGSEEDKNRGEQIAENNRRLTAPGALNHLNSSQARPKEESQKKENKEIHRSVDMSLSAQSR